MPLQLKPQTGVLTSAEQDPLKKLPTAIDPTPIDNVWIQPSDTAQAQPDGFWRNALDVATVSTLPVQPKLMMGCRPDRSEQEADRMADQVMGEIGVHHSHGDGEGVEIAEPVGSGMPWSADLASQLETSQGSGQPLPHAVKAFMEPRFKADFSQVRVHTGHDAVMMNRALQARAFTHGQHVYFGAGQTPANNALMAHELTHVMQQQARVDRPQAGSGAIAQRLAAPVIQRQPVAATPTASTTPATPPLPTVDELTARIARCIGIWETNRGKDTPAPRESELDTVAGMHASMATIEQATMAYAITALKKHKALRDQATPPLTLKELNQADARCAAVKTLLAAVTRAAAKGETPEDFINANPNPILATGLSHEDVETMFSAVTLKTTLDTARASAEAAGKTAKAEAAKAKKTPKQQAAAERAARQTSVNEAIAAISTNDRLGLGTGSLRTYINKPKTWGENQAAWQRKAVGLMPDNIGSRIEAVAISNQGTALAIPVIKSRVNAELAKTPVPSLEAIVKAVAQKNNPGEKNYGKNVWQTYLRLYPDAAPPKESAKK